VSTRKQHKVAVLCLVLSLAGTVGAQDPVKPVYIESFRKGSSRVTETAYDVTLNASNPRSKTRVLDANGRERYLLTFEPQFGGPNDPRFVTRVLANEGFAEAIALFAVAAPVSVVMESMPAPTANSFVAWKRVVAPIVVVL